MAAGRYDFTIEKGATFTRTVIWKDSSGVGINLTGYTLSGKIRRYPQDSKELISFTFVAANQGTDPGQFVFSLTAAQTSALPFSNSSSAEKQLLDCSYDIEALNGATVYRILEGVVSISPEVTR